MFTRRTISGKQGKHIITIRRRSRSRSRTPNSNSNSNDNVFQRQLRAARERKNRSERARMRLRTAMLKVLNQIRYRPGTGSKYKEAERRWYKRHWKCYGLVTSLSRGFTLESGHCGLLRLICLWCLFWLRHVYLGLFKKTGTCILFCIKYHTLFGFFCLFLNNIEVCMRFIYCAIFLVTLENGQYNHSFLYQWQFMGYGTLFSGPDSILESSSSSASNTCCE